MGSRPSERPQVTGSPLRGALLALLAAEDEYREPVGGYRLATLVERRLGPAWRVTRQSVYGALERLESDGIVQSSPRGQPGQRGEGQRVYAATSQTAEAYERWMRSPVAKEPVRVELHARIAVSRARHAPVLLNALAAYESDCIELLRRTKDAEVRVGSWAALALNLTRAATDEGIQAELRWIAMARRWIEDFIADHPASPRP